MNILKDIHSGALPTDEIPDFLAYLLRKSFWIFFAVILIGSGLILLSR